MSDGVARRAIRNRQNIIGSGRLQFGGTGRTPLLCPTPAVNAHGLALPLAPPRWNEIDALYFCNDVRRHS